MVQGTGGGMLFLRGEKKGEMNAALLCSLVLISCRSSSSVVSLFRNYIVWIRIKQYYFIIIFINLRYQTYYTTPVGLPFRSIDLPLAQPGSTIPARIDTTPT